MIQRSWYVNNKMLLSYIPVIIYVNQNLAFPTFQSHLYKKWISHIRNRSDPNYWCQTSDWEQRCGEIEYISFYWHSIRMPFFGHGEHLSIGISLLLRQWNYCFGILNLNKVKNIINITAFWVYLKNSKHTIIRVGWLNKV